MTLQTLSIDSEDVLGTNYIVTSLTVSNYNPTIDSTVTVTVTLKDVYNDPVVGEEVLVTASDGTFTQLNGSNITAASSVTGTTNSNGQFTLTYACSEWGLITFSANNTKTYARVIGWRTVSINITYATLRVNEAEKLCVLTYVRDFSAADADKFYTWHTGAIPSQYRPSIQSNGSMNQVGTLYVDSTGEIGGKFATSWSSNRTVKGTVMWYY